MTFISYAQNFEDVMLWRALHSVGAGVYIDVGAAHPDIDSVTRALYDRGWSGVNIEPVAAAALRLRAARPRDLTLQIALGEAAGRTEFFVVAAGTDTGLSTTVDATLERYQKDFDVQRTEVDMDTLAEVCRRHTRGPIHVLKVDVEGAERAVLAGADFNVFRPWIVLVEATAPMSTVETHGSWEGILLAAGYQFVWFDGLNRFYVAEEKAAELATYFCSPPNVFDDFVRAADTDWALRISRAEVRQAEAVLRARSAEERADRAASRLAMEATYTAELDRVSCQRRHELLKLRSLLNEVGRARQRADAELAQAVYRMGRLELQANVAGLRAQAIEQRAALGELEAQRLRAWLTATQASTSWRVTAPLRGVGTVIGRLRGRPILAPPWEHARDVNDLPAAAPAPDLSASPPPIAEIPEPRPARTYARPLRTVHQFHSGSATGDAITASMLMTRRLLREAGYRSNIFVEHRDPALANELHLFEELPLHDGYVLLVRHSMGHGVLERLLALPAPKVLLYHNITPPEYLGDPALRECARQGREQLADFRPHVAAALADSEYNALELRSLGFDPVRACVLLLDPANLRQASPETPGPARPFTILFVGRIIESKGQLELIESFGRFVHPLNGPSRLVLVGRHGGTADPYLEKLFAAIRRHGIDGHVILTGTVSDAERDRWYAEADLYVSLSHHEGFGVPLVEAMVHGVPVLAWPAGAVPDTLGGAAELLDDPSPSAVAARMLALARDPRRREDMARAGRLAAERFAPERHMPRLIEALTRAGAAPPPDPSARGTLAATMQFMVTGHVAGTYSLAGVNRALARAIEAARPGQVRVLPIEGTPFNDLNQVPAGEREMIVRLAGRGAPETGPEVVISQHYPIYVPPPRPGDLPLALVFWEESALPASMVAKLEQFRGVLAPSHFVAKALVDSGVVGPVRVLGQAPRLEPFLAMAAERKNRVRHGDEPTIFLHVSSCFPRKGVDVLLTAYARAFRHGNAVQLIIKGHANPHNDVPEQIARLQASDPDAPAIQYIGEDLAEAGLLALYRAADAMVLPTRGEGYNLPAAEAMAAGIPLIVTGLGGTLDYCGPEEARLLDYEFATSCSHLASAGSVWAEPSSDGLVTALREVVEQPETVRGRAMRARARVEREAGGAALVDRLGDIALDLLIAPPAEPVRVAWISSWGVRCGVAEYSRHLIAHLPPEGLAGVVVLADRRPPDGDDAGIGDFDLRVRREWDVGEPACVDQLASALMAEDPAAIVVQHQPALINWPSLGVLLRHPALLERATLVALHNTRQLLEIAAADLQAALDGLNRATRVLVHTVADLNLLKRLGLVGNVTLLPHGVPPRRPVQPVRALQPDDDALIGCYGFLLPPKGVPQLVQALGIIRRRWRHARLRLINAAYPLPEGDAELASCRAAILAAGLEDVVELVSDFLPHERSIDLLAECDLVVLPYQYSIESSSAALRTALAAGVPIAVTPLPLFEEAEDAVLRLDGFDVASIAANVDDLLADQGRRMACADVASRWMAERGWDAIGRRVAGMLRHLAAEAWDGSARSVL